MKRPTKNDRTFLLVIVTIAFSGIIVSACGGGSGEMGTPLPSPSIADEPAYRPVAPEKTHQAPPPADPFAAIDKILEQMRNGNIAFNTPQRMGIQDSATIQLKLGLNTEISDLKRLIKSEGLKEGFDIRVADRMEARLTGQNFTITAITPEVQAISGNEITSWSWEVKPRSKGKQYLHLTLTALIGVNGNSTPRTIRTFDKAIDVEITQAQQLESFIGENWQWLWATLLVPIAGWIWKSKTNKA
jgi:hypothetical protein